MHLIIISILFSCQFKPVYLANHSKLKLCSIKVDTEKNAAPLYEMDFKNELVAILCTEKVAQTNYLLKWRITKSYRELIKSESNTARRYEQTIVIHFNIHDILNDALIYSDSVTSKGAYNILEDEIISTLTSKKAVESQIAILAARLTLDKIHLFMLKDENSKL